MEPKPVFTSKTLLGLLIAYAGLRCEPALLALGFADPSGLAQEITVWGLALAGYGRLTAKEPLL